MVLAVVDSGIVSKRKSVCTLTKTGRCVITLDNAIFAHIANFFGLKAIHKLNDTTSRLPPSDEGHVSMTQSTKKATSLH